MDIIVLIDNLYISSNVINPEKVIVNISNNKFDDSAFLICLNNNSGNLMDIYYVQELKKSYINICNLIVLAVCHNKADARQVCTFIIERFMQEYNDFSDFKSKVGLVRWVKND